MTEGMDATLPDDGAMTVPDKPMAPTLPSPASTSPR
jgi:hypothetical protein